MCLLVTGGRRPTEASYQSKQRSMTDRSQMNRQHLNYVNHNGYPSLSTPLEVLRQFLHYYANFEWDKYAVTVRVMNLQSLKMHVVYININIEICQNVEMNKSLLAIVEIITPSVVLYMHGRQFGLHLFSELQNLIDIRSESELNPILYIL